MVVEARCGRIYRRERRSRRCGRFSANFEAAIVFSTSYVNGERQQLDRVRNDPWHLTVAFQTRGSFIVRAFWFSERD